MTMQEEFKKLKSEYKDILTEYLGKSEAKDLIKQLFSGYSPAQIEILFNSNFRIRTIVDRLVTSTEIVLSKKRHLHLLLDIAKLSLNRGELFLSSDVCSQVLFRTTKTKEYVWETATAFKGLGEVSSVQAKWIESFSYVQKAKKMYEMINDTLGVASCENLLGTFYSEKGDLDSAKKHFEAGLDIIKKKKGNLDALILVNLGILNNIIGNTKEAEKNYYKALKKFQKYDDNKRIAETLHNLGMLFTKVGNYKEAIKEFKSSIKVSQANGNVGILAISSLGIAYIYAEMGKLTLASEYIEQGMELSNKLNDRLTIADIYKVRGIIERKSNNYELAESYLLTSLRINSELGNKLNHSETSYELGLLYLEINQPEKAHKHLKSTLKYLRKIKSTSDIEKVESLLLKK